MNEYIDRYVTGIIKDDAPDIDRKSENEFLNGVLFGLLKKCRNISIRAIFG
jgi:hypothetical protein